MQTTRSHIFHRALCTTLVSLAAILAAGTTVRANTVTQSLDFRLNSATPSTVLHFDPFDGMLGTLNSVDVSFDATRRHALGLWNVSGVAGAVPYDVKLEDTTLTMDGNIFGFADLHYGPAATPVLSSTGFPAFLLQFLAGQAQFLAGQEPVFGSDTFQPATSLTAITDSFAASSFASVLNLSLAYDPGVFSTEASGSFTGSLVDVFGLVTVTYGYTAHAVPESSVGAGVLALTWFGLIGLSARFRPRSNTAG